MVGGNKFTKISDLSPNMLVPITNVIVEVDKTTLQQRLDGSVVMDVGDASGSITMIIPKESLDVFNERAALAFVIKNVLCLVVGSTLMLQVSSNYTEISRVDKLPVPFFRRNKARNISEIDFTTSIESGERNSSMTT